LRRVMTNTELLDIIRFLKTTARKNNAEIWETAAEHLSRPRRARAILNLNHVARLTNADSLVLIPGKLLGSGEIKHAVKIGAFQYSTSARAKVERAGGECMALKDFVARYPKGSNVRLVK